MRFAIDVITRAMFSQNFNTQRDESNPLPLALQRCVDELAARAHNPLRKYHPYLVWKFEKQMSLLKNSVLEVIRSHREKGTQYLTRRNYFLD